MQSFILNYLKAHTHSSIKAVTGSTYFNRGNEYFKAKHILGFSWNKTNTILTAEIEGSTGNYEVSIETNKKSFKITCDCPAWTKGAQCKHVACFLISCAAFLKNPDSQNSYDKKLQKQLLKGYEIEAESISYSNNHNYSLHFVPYAEDRRKGLSFYNPTFMLFLYDGESKASSKKILPFRLAAMLEKPFLMAENEEPELYNELRNLSIPLTLKVHAPNGVQTITLDKENLVSPITEITTHNDSVVVKTQLMSEQKKHTVLMQSFIRLGKYFILNLTTNVLMFINQTEAWDWALTKIDNYIKSILFSKQKAKFLKINKLDALSLPFSYLEGNKTFPFMGMPLVISKESFNTNFKFTSNFADQIILKKHDLEAPLSLQDQQPTLVIVGEVDVQKKCIRLRPTIELNDQRVSLDYPLHEYLQSMQAFFFAGFCKKDVKNLLAQGIFLCISEPLPSINYEKKIQKIIKKIKSLSKYKLEDAPIKNYFDTFYRRLLYNKTSEFDGFFEKTFFEEYFEEEPFEEKDFKTQLVLADNAFYKVKCNYFTLWRHFSILNDFFEESFEILDDYKASCFSVSLDLFYQKLAALQKTLNQFNIALTINDKPLKTGALDVSLDLSNATENNWFDVKPEILAHGIPLTNKQLEILFSGQGIFENDNAITFFDQQTQDLIAVLARIFGKKTNGETSQKADKYIKELQRLHIFDLLEFHKSNVRITGPDKKIIEGLMNFSTIEELATPTHLNALLRDYQKTGYNWLAFLYKHHFGACLADDMGLGKTLQTITFLAGITEGIISSRTKTKVPHIIVVPPTLLFNWLNELEKFYPALRCKTYAGADRNPNFENYDIILTTYDMVRIDSDFFKSQIFHVLILDEAQVIKNIKSGKTSAVRNIKALFTITITGTPLENHIGEYYSILDLSVPGLLPSYKDFMHLAKENEHSPLIKKMSTFILRRTKESAQLNLPEKNDANIILEMSAKQKKIYATTAAEVKKAIAEAYATKTGPQAQIVTLSALLRLRQICISPELIDSVYQEETPKMTYLLEKLKVLIEEGNAALLFSQFTACLDILEKILQKANIPYYRIDGSISVLKRKKIIEAFQNNTENIPILLLSLKTGGVGLNLTRANYVFHVDPWWNPAVENQASDRAHRIGQKKVVFVHRLIMHNTIEEKMMALKEKKQQLFNEIIENAAHKKDGSITKKDLDVLLS